MATVDIPDPPRMTGQQFEDTRQLFDYAQKLAEILRTINAEADNHEARITALEP